MFRRTLLPQACVILALGLAWPASAWSQDRSTAERLDRLERDLNMLQRQVYRGMPPPGMGGDPGAAVNAEIRMDRIEGQMRELTGRIEEFMNQVAQLRQRLEQLNGDIETRFSQAGPAPGFAPSVGTPQGPPRPSATSPARPPRQLAAQPPPNPDEDDDAPRFPPPGGPTALLPRGAPPPGAPGAGPTPIFGMLTPPGTLTPPGEPGARSAPAAAAGPPNAAGGLLPNGSATEQYNFAFGLVKQADYPAAEAALKAFVDHHPKDPMAGNAQYWLGETYYTRGMYLEAATAFAEAYKRYPKSAKAADDLLKLGMSLARANQKQNACLALAQLDRDFPHPSATIKERAAAEKKRIGC